MSYDEQDMKDSYRAGYWIGVVSGLGGMFLLCLGLGLLIKYGVIV